MKTSTGHGSFRPATIKSATGADAARFRDGDPAQNRNDDAKNDGVNHFVTAPGMRRQSTFVLKFARPATSRASTTENEMTSSSQSWL